MCFTQNFYFEFLFYFEYHFFSKKKLCCRTQKNKKKISNKEYELGFYILCSTILCFNRFFTDANCARHIRIIASALHSIRHITFRFFVITCHDSKEWTNTFTKD